MAPLNSPLFHCSSRSDEIASEPDLPHISFCSQVQFARWAHGIPALACTQSAICHSLSLGSTEVSARRRFHFVGSEIPGRISALVDFAHSQFPSRCADDSPISVACHTTQTRRAQHRAITASPESPPRQTLLISIQSSCTTQDWLLTDEIDLYREYYAIEPLDEPFWPRKHRSHKHSATHSPEVSASSILFRTFQLLLCGSSTFPFGRKHSDHFSLFSAAASRH